MKKVLVVLFVGLMGFALQAQEKVAEITFKSDTVNYGEIEKGANGVRIFEFTNTGTSDLVVTNVKSSCGCTIPEKPEAPIPPGGTGVIKVKYDTNRPGPIRKTITVFSNASTPAVPLKIKGNVIDPAK